MAKTIYCENEATRRLAFTPEDGGERIEVTFERGLAEVPDAAAEVLAARFPGIREAEPEDLDPWDRADATDGARELARERGIEPDEVEGTGSGGRITKKDVRRAAGD